MTYLYNPTDPLRWKIKARITSKSDMKRWSNARGEGTLFSIDLLDSAGGEIRATFFKDACEKWFPQLEEQKVDCYCIVLLFDSPYLDAHISFLARCTLSREGD